MHQSYLKLFKVLMNSRVYFTITFESADVRTGAEFKLKLLAQIMLVAEEQNGSTKNIERQNEKKVDHFNKLYKNYQKVKKITTKNAEICGSHKPAIYLFVCLLHFLLLLKKKLNKGFQFCRASALCLFSKIPPKFTQ